MRKLSSVPAFRLLLVDIMEAVADRPVGSTDPRVCFRYFIDNVGHNGLNFEPSFLRALGGPGMGNREPGYCQLRPGYRWPFDEESPTTREALIWAQLRIVEHQTLGTWGHCGTAQFPGGDWTATVRFDRKSRLLHLS